MDQEEISGSSGAELPQSDPTRKPFVPEDLDRTVIAIPLLKKLQDEKIARDEDPRIAPQLHKVIIDLNLQFPGGRDEARRWVVETTRKIVAEVGVNKDPNAHGINTERSALTPQYLFGSLEGDVIRELVFRDEAENGARSTDSASSTRAIFHIWPDFEIRALTTKSISTVKADAARASFAAQGDDIVWAVMDSGIDVGHRHFKLHKNTEVDLPLEHLDFTGENRPNEDPYGHGTHVGGIIAGELKVESSNAEDSTNHEAFAVVRGRNEQGVVSYNRIPIKNISGMAPRCKLVSLRVLDSRGRGDVSSLIAAIAKIQEINGYGRRLLIHGVNISVGNDFDPEWFACGQSPLCSEVNHLVNSGVVVVVAAGNSGYGSLQSKFTGVVSAGLSLTINDPGNADNAITVGSTHRDMPHIYGVSYFSSKGPTGDGRLKPDLVAPGEKIISCAAGATRTKATEKQGECDYVEDSGTSMAAPHVAGVIAAFLSIRREFIGQPDKVKQIFLSTATDLKRERYFQGSGLVDLMRAIQSV
jgi:subtilisin family serine protease